MGAKVRVKVKADRGHTDRQVNLFIYEQKNRVIRRTHQAVKTFLALATQYTPKYSGDATESWEVSADVGGAVKSQRNLGTLPTDTPEPEYERGIYDAAAPALNKRAAKSAYDHIKPVISARLKRGREMKLTFYNTAPQSEIWMGGKEDASAILREVNQDYYTYRDLDGAFKAVMKSREIY